MLERWRLYVQKKIGAMLVLVCLQATANGQPATSFFPFHVGDVWQYRYAAGPLAWTDHMDSIIADTGSVLYVRVRRIDHDGNFSSFFWYVIKDSILIYRDGLPRPPLPPFTRLMYKLDAGLGQAWTVQAISHVDTTYREVAKVAAVDTTLVFGRWVSYKDIVYGMTRIGVTDTAWTGDTLSLASDFGLIFGYIEPMGPVLLSGAIINNVQWGFILDVEEQVLLPSQLVLSQNHPNPFNPSTTIQFSVPHQTWIKLAVYDVLGRQVQCLLDQVLPPGTHSTIWNASRYSSGVYFYRMQGGGVTMTRKMLLQK